MPGFIFSYRFKMFDMGWLPLPACRSGRWLRHRQLRSRPRGYRTDQCRWQRATGRRSAGPGSGPTGTVRARRTGLERRPGTPDTGRHLTRDRGARDAGAVHAPGLAGAFTTLGGWPTRPPYGPRSDPHTAADYPDSAFVRCWCRSMARTDSRTRMIGVPSNRWGAAGAKLG